MSRIDEFRRQLLRVTIWEPFLLEHPRLPGPRGNREFAQAAAAIGGRVG